MAFISNKITVVKDVRKDIIRIVQFYNKNKNKIKICLNIKMSCPLKNNTPRRLQRTEYDMAMMEKYDPNVQAPNWWSGVGANADARSQVDLNMYKEWCPNCDPNSPHPRTYEAYCQSCETKPYGLQDRSVGPAYVGPRTTFDKELQSKWCPTCPPPDMYKEDFSDYLMSFHDTDNRWSYGGCGCGYPGCGSTVVLK